MLFSFQALIPDTISPLLDKWCAVDPAALPKPKLYPQLMKVCAFLPCDIDCLAVCLLLRSTRLQFSWGYGTAILEPRTIQDIVDTGVASLMHTQSFYNSC